MTTSNPIRETDYLPLYKCSKILNVHQRILGKVIAENHIHHIRIGKKIILAVPAVIKTYLPT